MSTCRLHEYEYTRLFIPHFCWYHHPKYGKDFREFIDKMNDELGPMDDAADATVSPTGGKRRASTTSTLQPAAKAQKTSHVRLVEAATIDASKVLSTVAMTNVKATKPVELNVMMDKRFTIVNTGDQEVHFDIGALTAGFGKGKFASAPSLEGINLETDVPFHLKSSDDLVVLNNTCTTLGDVVKEKRKNNPSIGVAYHTIEETPGEDFAFTLTAKNHVIFKPDGRVQMENVDNIGSAKMTQNNVAGLTTADMWTCNGTGVIWSVQWKAIGLMPIRPHVMFTTPVSIPPARAFCSTTPGGNAAC